jgi:hypothetical protein
MGGKKMTECLQYHPFFCHLFAVAPVSVYADMCAARMNRIYLCVSALSAVKNFSLLRIVGTPQCFAALAPVGDFC